MLPAFASGDVGSRTAADNQTVRNVFIIGPDKKIKLVLVYPMTTGRNFQEILRVIDSLQMTAKHRVATPADWKQGEDVIIAGSVSDDVGQDDLSAGLEIAEALYPDRAAAEVTSSPASRTCANSSWPEHSRTKDGAASGHEDIRLQISRAIKLASISPMVADTAVANVPQHTSTTTTGHVQCFKSDSEVSSNVA